MVTVLSVARDKWSKEQSETITHLALTLPIVLVTRAGTLQVTAIWFCAFYRTQAQRAVREIVEAKQTLVAVGAIIVQLARALACEWVTVVVIGTVGVTGTGLQ